MMEADASFAAPLDLEDVRAARERWPGAEVQLADGALAIGPAPDAAARHAIRIVADALQAYVSETGIGAVDVQRDVFFDARNLRVPDVAYRRRVNAAAPDLVVEVLSSFDRLRAYRGRVDRYLELGVAAGLLLDPANRTVLIVRGGEPVVPPDGMIAFPEVLDGWSIAVADLW